MSRLVVDTDCGTDDAMALALLLSRPEWSSRLEAVTCCFGNTTVDNACDNVFRVLHHYHPALQIPVYRGAQCPLLGSAGTSDIEDIHGPDGFGNCSTLYETGGRTTSDGSAAWRLCQLARLHPGDLTIVALAPLTNLALAHRLDPEFTRNLKSIVCMGGNYKGIGNVTEWAEFNFFSDPESAHVVLSEALCTVILVPWETTLEHGIHWEEYDHLMSLPRADLLRDVTQVVWRYCRANGDPAFLDCDVLAMAAALDPQGVCTDILEGRSITVECGQGQARGACMLREGGTVEVVTRMDDEALKALRRSMVE